MIVRTIRYEDDLPAEGQTSTEICAKPEAWLRSVDWMTYPEAPRRARVRSAVVMSVMMIGTLTFFAGPLVAIAFASDDKPLSAVAAVLLATLPWFLLYGLHRRHRKNRHVVGRILTFDGTNFVMHHSILGPYVKRRDVEATDFRTRFLDSARYFEEWRISASHPIRVELAPTGGHLPGGSGLTDVYFVHEGRRHVFSRSSVNAFSYAENVEDIANWQHLVVDFIGRYSRAAAEAVPLSPTVRRRKGIAK